MHFTGAKYSPWVLMLFKHMHGGFHTNAMHHYLINQVLPFQLMRVPFYTKMYHELYLWNMIEFWKKTSVTVVV